jgi:hypothetical protein
MYQACMQRHRTYEQAVGWRPVGPTHLQNEPTAGCKPWASTSSMLAFVCRMQESRKAHHWRATTQPQPTPRGPQPNLKQLCPCLWCPRLDSPQPPTTRHHHLSFRTEALPGSQAFRCIVLLTGHSKHAGNMCSALVTTNPPQHTDPYPRPSNPKHKPLQCVSQAFHSTLPKQPASSRSCSHSQSKASHSLPNKLLSKL